MSTEKKLAYRAALENAAEMIRGHLEVGITKDELGHDEDIYKLACNKVYKKLMKLAEKVIVNVPDKS